jgi:hypothetical protein
MAEPSYLSDATHVISGNSLELDPASLDALRALLSAFANSGADFADPVSHLTLHHEFRRRNKTRNVTAGLQLLSDVRDVQRLSRGFWLPATTVLVPCVGFRIVVSGNPTHLLQGEFQDVMIATGASRLIAGTVSPDVAQPTIPFLDWLNGPENTLTWAQTQLKTPKMVDPHGLVGMEIFRHWKAANPRRWVPVDSQWPGDSEMLLARHRGTTGQTNHYLLKTQARRIIGMAELPHALDTVLRLQVALRAMSGDNAVFFHETTPAEETVRISYPTLPDAERRLLNAVSTPKPQRNPGLWDAAIPSIAMEQVVSTLTALGLESRGQSA